MTKENKKASYVAPNAFVGSCTGLLKSVDFKSRSAKNHFEDGKFGKDFEISSMCWDSSDKNKINLGLKKGVIRSFYPEENLFEEPIQIPDIDPENDDLCSLHKVGNAFVVGMSSGKVISFDPAKEEFDSISCGDNMTCMASLPGHEMIATGGKENSLRVWDLNNTEKPVFIAKNVRDDHMQLRVPIWETSIQFVDNSPTKVLTTTGSTHRIRIYDLSSRQRRPVLETTFDEYPITTSSVVQREPNKVFVANTHGSLASFDIRKLKNVYRCYKGSFGSVRHIQNHPELPYMFSCGLDRYLRVHSEKDSVLAYKVHLKSQLNCLLVTDAALETNSSNTKPGDKKSVQKKNEAEKDNDEDEESVWNEMKSASESDDEEDVDNEQVQAKKRKIK